MNITFLSTLRHSVFKSLPHYRSTSFEDAITYDRIDGQSVEMVLSHLPNVSGDYPPTPTLTLASFRSSNNPKMKPHQHLELSMEEARLLRDLLNRPEVTEWLNEGME